MQEAVPELLAYEDDRNRVDLAGLDHGQHFRKLIQRAKEKLSAALSEMEEP